jgi:hypothetical protein
MKSILFKIAKWIYTHLVPPEIYTAIIFKKIHGYKLNLDAPVTLNEKLHWMKLRGPKFIDPKLVDKYLAREFIESTVGSKYLVPLIAVYEDSNEYITPEIDFMPVIVKTTHDSGIGFIYHTPNDHELSKVRKNLRVRMNKNHYFSTKEYPYRLLKPRIIVERLLCDEQGNLPNDYKFHFFNGQLEFIYCTIDRGGKDLRHIYNHDWHRQDFVWNKVSERFDMQSPDLPIPQNFSEMIEVGVKLAEGFPYIRVDFYNINGKIYCGELTFFQGSGFDKLTPYVKDVELGKKINVDEVSKILAFEKSFSTRPKNKT